MILERLRGNDLETELLSRERQGGFRKVVLQNNPDISQSLVYLTYTSKYEIERVSIMPTCFWRLVLQLE